MHRYSIIIALAIVFPTNTPNRASFILIKKIEAIAEPFIDPIIQNRYKYTEFRSIAIPIGMSTLSSTIGTMYKNINLIYSK